MTYGTPSDWSDEAVNQLKALAADGLSTGQVAKEMGFTRAAVSGKAKRLGIKFKGAGANQYHCGLGHRRPAALEGSRRTSKPRSKPPAPPPAQPGVHSVLDLKTHHCRWPIGEPDQPGFGFCGATKDEGSAYCAGHRAKGTVPTQSRVKPPYEYSIQRVRAA